MKMLCWFKHRWKETVSKQTDTVASGLITMGRNMGFSCVLSLEVCQRCGKERGWRSDLNGRRCKIHPAFVRGDKAG